MQSFQVSKQYPWKNPNTLNYPILCSKKYKYENIFFEVKNTSSWIWLCFQFLGHSQNFTDTIWIVLGLYFFTDSIWILFWDIEKWIVLFYADLGRYVKVWHWKKIYWMAWSNILSTQNLIESWRIKLLLLRNVSKSHGYKT